MRNSLRFLTAMTLLIGLLSSSAHAQCQLAFNEEQNQEFDAEALLDLTIFDDINPENEQFTDIPVCNLPLLRSYAQGLFETGEYELQSRIYTYILRHERDTFVMYNLACSFSRMGQAEKALEYLEHAFNFGYEDIEWVEEDTDMDIVRELPRYSEVIAQQRERIATNEESRKAIELYYVECPSIQECQVVLPENFDQEASSTLVIGLHGAGDTADRFSTLSGYFGENDFIYAAPQAPLRVASQNDSFVWFNELSWSSPEMFSQSRDMLITYVDNVIAQMVSQYSIDRIYLVGFSQGAVVSYLAGISRPDIIDGIVVFGGWLDPEWFTDNELSAASDLGVFIAQGNEDNIEDAHESRDVLEEAGFQVDFNEFQGGHFIHLDTLHEAVEWMKE